MEVFGAELHAMYEGLKSLNLRSLPLGKLYIYIDNTAAIVTHNSNPLNYDMARKACEEGKVLADRGLEIWTTWTPSNLGIRKGIDWQRDKQASM
jgi:hypothetical protein